MKSSNFQIIITAVFIFFLVLGVLIFSGLVPLGKDKTAEIEGTGKVVLWGTIKRQAITPLIEDFNNENRAFSLSYEEKSPETFDSELVEALASGKGPDLFLLPDYSVVRHSERIATFPYENFPERTFRDTYISEANIYLTTNGVLALPIAVDPLVMYYNQDTLEGAGISKAPVSWEEVVELAPKLTKKDSSGNPIKSTIALGSFENISYAKDIIATLFFQLGNPIVSNNNGTLVSVMSEKAKNSNVVPGELALSFYTDFSNPQKSNYSWSRGMQNSRDAFIAGDLTLYIGRASDLFTIRESNPNLRFDVAKIPQGKGDGTIQATHGAMLSVAISKASKNISTAYIASTKLAGKTYAEKISAILSIPPARRDLLVLKPVNNPYISVFYDSALISKGWLDPENKSTSSIFSSMISGIASGRTNSGSALFEASNQVNILLRGKAL